MTFDNRQILIRWVKNYIQKPLCKIIINGIKGQRVARFPFILYFGDFNFTTWLVIGKKKVYFDGLFPGNDFIMIYKAKTCLISKGIQLRLVTSKITFDYKYSFFNPLFNLFIWFCFGIRHSFSFLPLIHSYKHFNSEQLVSDISKTLFPNKW